MLEYKNINKDKLQEDFANSVEKKPLAATLILGNLFFLKDKVTSTQLKLVDNCISAICKQITPKQLNTLFTTSLTIEKAHRELMEKGTQEVLDAFVFHALSDKRLRENINNENLVLCATKAQYTLSAVVTLIQNHLIINKQANPFEGFDYKLLTSASHHQLKDSLSAMVKKCQSLPQVELIQIGKQSEAVAKIIINIIYSHEKRCEIEEKFAEQYPNMRPKIAKQWTKTAATVPQTTAKASSMNQSATQLAKKHPEFKQVTMTKRAPKDEAPTNQERQHNAVPPLTVIGAIYGMAMKPAAATVGKMCLLSASAGPFACLGPVAIPIAFAAAGAAMGLLCNMNHENKAKSTASQKPKP